MTQTGEPLRVCPTRNVKKGLIYPPFKSHKVALKCTDQHALTIHRSVLNGITSSMDG